MHRRWLSVPAIMLAAALVAVFGSAGDTARQATAAPGKVALDASPKIHPLLQYGAQTDPNAKVRVLVTRVKDPDPKKDRDKERDIAAAVDADDDEDFVIARTQSLVIKQKDVYKLARHKDVRFISPDGAVKPPAAKGKKDDVDTRKGPNKAAVMGSKPALPAPPPDPAKLATTFPRAVDADKLWTDKDRGATGKGVTVAVLDTGIAAGHPDFAATEVVSVTANRRALGAADTHGHGTHVAGIVAGRSPDGKYVGIAPDARVISVKVADDDGNATESDLLRGLQWVYENRQKYSIRAVNLSLSGAVPSSYLTSPIAAAAEQLWFGGVVVVAAAGNQGNARDAAWHAPGNDPFVITVGCIDDNRSDGPGDDTQCSFSSRGRTQDGFVKPDVMAPGRKIYAPLVSRQATLGVTYPDRITPDGLHIRLSGTSASAPVVTGLVALLLERYPSLTPDQVKGALMGAGRSYKAQSTKALVVDADKLFDLVDDGKQKPANQGITPSSAINPITGTVAPAQTYWDQTYWDQTYWDQTYWDQTYWDQADDID